MQRSWMRDGESRLAGHRQASPANVTQFIRVTRHQPNSSPFHSLGVRTELFGSSIRSTCGACR
jgi:hypothetical protein